MECAAQYHEDGKWYRAEVTEITPNGVTVNFVDYGNTQKCKVSDLRALPETLSTSPFAFRCCLARIRQTRAWNDDESAHFCSVDGGMVHDATVVKTEDGINHIR